MVAKRAEGTIVLFLFFAARAKLFASRRVWEVCCLLLGGGAFFLCFVGALVVLLAPQDIFLMVYICTWR